MDYALETMGLSFTVRFKKGNILGLVYQNRCNQYVKIRVYICQSFPTNFVILVSRVTEKSVTTQIRNFSAHRKNISSEHYFVSGTFLRDPKIRLAVRCCPSKGTNVMYCRLLSLHIPVLFIPGHSIILSIRFNQNHLHMCKIGKTGADGKIK